MNLSRRRFLGLAGMAAVGLMATGVPKPEPKLAKAVADARHLIAIGEIRFTWQFQQQLELIHRHLSATAESIETEWNRQTLLEAMR